MGDLSEIRGIIVVGTFLGIALTLILIMPSELLGGSETPQINNVALSNLLATNDTYTYNFTGTFSRSPNIDIGGWHTCISETNPLDKEFYDNASRVFQFEITDAWYTYFYNREDFRWKDHNTNSYVDNFIMIEVPPSFNQEEHYIISMHTLEEYASNMAFEVSSSRCKMNVFFQYDPAIYTTPLDAYNHMGLSMVIGVNFDERNTQVSAWSFVYNLFFFQNIAGLDSTISNLIRIPFMLALGYILFICVLRVIGAVFGGGGA